MAAGAWALRFFAVLLVAAADDIIARLLAVPVTGLVHRLQVLAATLPFAVAAVTVFVARALRASSAAHVSELTARDMKAAATGAHPAAIEPEGRDELARMWRNPDDTWRWQRSGLDQRGECETLMSNEVFETRDAALEAAGTAYPGVLVRQGRGTRRAGPATPVAPTRAAHPDRGRSSPGRCWWCSAAEAVAPTRPHPGMQSAKGNIAAGPVLAVVDRVRDAVRRAAEGKH
ncbi:hypothetical protein ABT297_25775 [Dactylosporangium sp. NPDC000555]|uniref:hypothetical protein n=1 Tax=Dactylosporangium sp. NPDC000555 TaxID=3154260 RepID=UPI00331ECC3F